MDQTTHFRDVTDTENVERALRERTKVQEAADNLKQAFTSSNKK